MLKISDSCDKIGIYAGLLFEPLFFLFLLVAVITNPWFDFTINALSDLGSKTACCPWLFNMGIIVSSMVNLIFSLRILLKFNKPLNLLGYGMILASIFFMAIGIFTEDTGFYVTQTMNFHNFFTILGFTLGSLTILIYEIYWSIKKEWRYIGIPLLFLSMTIPAIYLSNAYISLALFEMAFAMAILMWSYATVYFYLRQCDSYGDNEDKSRS